MRTLFILIHFLFIYSILPAQEVIWGTWESWGDMGDGTYRNPVLPADFSDIDCIRVGEDYYAISSTFQYSPGMIILHSKDLVNWRIAGHAVPDITQISPALGWQQMDRYGRGIWAGAIHYHNNRFYIYFGTPDEGLFMTSAPVIEGPWEPLHCMKQEKGWDDCCAFFNDNGQNYYIATHFTDNYKTYLYELSADGKNICEESKILINEGMGREASKLYKINDFYYHFYSEHIPGTGRYIMMQRSKNITGPYTEKRQLSYAQPEVNEPNQGGLVEVPGSGWFFLTHHGTGDWGGRETSLLPVTWIDGWPVIGRPDEKGTGTMIWQHTTPLQHETAGGYSIQRSDNFTTSGLSPQWEWNYAPREEKWSLTENPGNLRLKAFVPLEQDNLLKAGNTLSQRSFRTKHNEAVIRMDITGMQNGQKAGLCHYSKNYAMLGIVCEQQKRYIEYKSGTQIIRGSGITGNKIYIRSVWGLNGESCFSYSEDGITYTSFGPSYQLQWGYYRGDRIGIYNYNNLCEEGYVDIEEFCYHIE
ncbi:MAG: glycoside hydrolase 43 family protein [Tannerellaceae bacterium]|nr:glycoside hydrolase 43 family protein [Tannerellaceae bacterium]